MKHLAFDDGHSAIISARAQDDAFCEAMRAAIRSKAESPSIGIDHRPCTDSPRLMIASSAEIGGSWIDFD